MNAAGVAHQLLAQRNFDCGEDGIGPAPSAATVATVAGLHQGGDSNVRMAVRMTVLTLLSRAVSLF